MDATAMPKLVKRAKAPVPKTSSPNGHPSRLDMSYLEGTIGYAVRRAQIAIFQDIYRSFADLSITTVQFSVLAVLADNPGTLQADLAAALAVERPRMVPVIDSLERRGLARRISATADRRQKNIFLTPEGEALLGEAKRRFAKHQENILQLLDPEEARQFLGQLWRLAKL